MYVDINEENVRISNVDDLNKFKYSTLGDKIIYKIPGNLILKNDISIPNGILWCSSKHDNIHSNLSSIMGQGIKLECAALLCANASLENCDLILNNLVCENIIADSIHYKNPMTVSLNKLLEQTNLFNADVNYNSNQLDAYLSKYNAIVGEFYLFNKEDIEATNNIKISDENAQEITFYGGNYIVDTTKSKNEVSLLAGNMMGSGHFNNLSLVTYLGTSYKTNNTNEINDSRLNLFGYTNQKLGIAIGINYNAKGIENELFTSEFKRKIILKNDWSSDVSNVDSHDTFSDKSIGVISVCNLHCKDLYTNILSIAEFANIENNLKTDDLLSNHNLSSIYTKYASFELANVYSLNAEEIKCKTLIADKKVVAKKAVFSDKKSVIKTQNLNIDNLIIPSKTATIICDNKENINIIDYDKWILSNKGAQKQ